MHTIWTSFGIFNQFCDRMLIFCDSYIWRKNVTYTCATLYIVQHLTKHELATFIQRERYKQICYASHSCSHFWDTTDDVIFIKTKLWVSPVLEDILEVQKPNLELDSCLSDPPAWNHKIIIQDVLCSMYKLEGTFSDCNRKIVYVCSYKTKSLLSKTPPQNHRDSSGPYLKNPKIETHPTHGELPLSSGQLITQLDSLPAEANPSHWSHFSKLASFTLNTRA